MRIAEVKKDFASRCRIVHLFIVSYKEGIQDRLYEYSPYAGR